MSLGAVNHDRVFKNHFSHLQVIHKKDVGYFFFFKKAVFKHQHLTALFEISNNCFLHWPVTYNWLCYLLLDARMEEFVYEKLDRKAPSRMNNPEILGQHMIDAGNEFGPGTAYGK